MMLVRSDLQLDVADFWKAFRIEKPQMDRSEKPQVLWGDDVHAAWEQAKERAATKLDASFP